MLGICHQIGNLIFAIEWRQLILSSDSKLGICHQVAPLNIDTREKVGYFPSNGANTNVVHYDLDLYFKITISGIYKYAIS